MLALGAVGDRRLQTWQQPDAPLTCRDCLGRVTNGRHLMKTGQFGLCYAMIYNGKNGRQKNNQGGTDLTSKPALPKLTLAAKDFCARHLLNPHSTAV